jgi:hypothetical protein
MMAATGPKPRLAAFCRQHAKLQEESARPRILVREISKPSLRVAVCGPDRDLGSDAEKCVGVSWTMCLERPSDTSTGSVPLMS